MPDTKPVKIVASKDLYLDYMKFMNSHSLRIDEELSMLERIVLGI